MFVCPVRSDDTAAQVCVLLGLPRREAAQQTEAVGVTWPCGSCLSHLEVLCGSVWCPLLLLQVLSRLVHFLLPAGFPSPQEPGALTSSAFCRLCGLLSRVAGKVSVSDRLSTNRQKLPEYVAKKSS